MMNLESFKELVKCIEKDSTIYNTLSKIGINILDSDSNNNFNDVVDIALKSSFNEYGVDLFYWWMYEMDKESDESQLWDKNDKPIVIKGVEDLYTQLVDNYSLYKIESYDDDEFDDDEFDDDEFDDDDDEKKEYIQKISLDEYNTFKDTDLFYHVDVNIKKDSVEIIGDSENIQSILLYINLYRVVKDSQASELFRYSLDMLKKISDTIQPQYKYEYKANECSGDCKCKTKCSDCKCKE